MLKEIVRRNKGYVILALICSLPIVFLNMFSTYIIQNMGGVHALNTYKAAAYILAAVMALVCIYKIVSSSKRLIGEQKEKEKTAEEIERIKAENAIREKNEKAKLNIREPLKDTVIYERMKRWQNEDWGNLTNTKIPALMSDILRQMDEMNGYQAKLSRLLTNNGADYLEDTNGVLESVEQSILKKVRKILNCFVVYDSAKPDDIEKMQQLLDETKASNDAQLGNVKEFLFAITDFLNKQGDDNTGMEKLDIYKKTILDSTFDRD